jgi:hypothetical protein
MMIQHEHMWFAWHPVKCEDGTWVFWKPVLRRIETYQHWYLQYNLPPKITYYKIV